MTKVTAIIKATIALNQAGVLYGRSIGARGLAVGEVIFNTSVTGYQETTTDPSYLSQVILFTFPHIGNSGVNQKDMESDRTQVSGIIARSVTTFCTGVRLVGSFVKFCKSKGTMLITGVDTRKLTKLIRSNGTARVCILTDSNSMTMPLDIARSLANDISTGNLTKRTTTNRPVTWFHKDCYAMLCRLKVIAFDFGMKFSLLRNLIRRGNDLVVLSAYTQYAKAMELEVNGILFTNGPGDPRTIQSVVDNVRVMMWSNTPILGICLGHQVVSLVLGAKVKQLMPGHHGTNHPVKELKTGKILITSQNHNYSTDLVDTIDGLKVSYISLFDESVQGIESYKHPVVSFQGHPEACPGPRDAEYLFDSFTKAAQRNRNDNDAKETGHF